MKKKPLFLMILLAILILIFPIWFTALFTALIFTVSALFSEIIGFLGLMTFPVRIILDQVFQAFVALCPGCVKAMENLPDNLLWITTIAFLLFLFIVAFLIRKVMLK